MVGLCSLTENITQVLPKPLPHKSTHVTGVLVARELAGVTGVNNSYNQTQFYLFAFLITQLCSRYSPRFVKAGFISRH